MANVFDQFDDDEPAPSPYLSRGHAPNFTPAQRVSKSANAAARRRVAPERLEPVIQEEFGKIGYIADNANPFDYVDITEPGDGRSAAAAFAALPSRASPWTVRGGRGMKPAAPIGSERNPHTLRIGGVDPRTGIPLGEFYTDEDGEVVQNKPSFLERNAGALTAGLTDAPAGLLALIGDSLAGQGPQLPSAGGIDTTLIQGGIDAAGLMGSALDAFGINPAKYYKAGARELGGVARDSRALAHAGLPQDVTIDNLASDPLGTLGNTALTVEESLPLIAGAVATRQPVLGAMVAGGGTGLSTYGQDRLAGDNPQLAGTDAATQAVLEALFEIAPLSKIMAPGSGKPLRDLAGAGLSEAVGEGITGAGQYAAGEALHDRPVDAATALQQGINSAAAGFGTGTALRTPSTLAELLNPALDPETQARMDANAARTNALARELVAKPRVKVPTELVPTERTETPQEPATPVAAPVVAPEAPIPAPGAAPAGVAALPASVFNGDAMHALSNTFGRDDSPESVELSAFGYSTEEQKQLEAAGLATNGRISDAQFRQLDQAYSDRLQARRERKAPADPLAPRVPERPALEEGVTQEQLLAEVRDAQTEETRAAAAARLAAFLNKPLENESVEAENEEGSGQEAPEGQQAGGRDAGQAQAVPPLEQARASLNTALGTAAGGVELLPSPRQMPASTRQRLGLHRPENAGVEGVIDPDTGIAYVFENNLDTKSMPREARRVWVGMHERAGHAGIRGSLGPKLDIVLRRAVNNPTINKIATAIAGEYVSQNLPITRERAVEEALAEIAAAIRTGRTDHLLHRYGATVTAEMEGPIKGLVARAVEAIKSYFKERTGQSLTDQDVYKIIEGAWRYAKTGETKASKAESTPVASRKPADPKTVSKFLRDMTPDEAAELTTATANKLIEDLKQLPKAEEMAAIGWAGRAKRGWYARSVRAISDVFGPDAPRFAALLAAMSPQISVEGNLENALSTWRTWIVEGRPTDPIDIRDILRRSVRRSADKGADKSSVLPAWEGNSVEALSAPDPSKVILSGPKVDSFMRNLVGDVTEVTNDAWMAAYANVDADLFSGNYRKMGGRKVGRKSGGYLAMNVLTRRAARILSAATGETWTPAEVQETVWSWSKTLTEMAKSAKYGGRDEATLLDDKELTDELIAATPDFGTLFTDPAYAGILAEAGYDDQIEGLRRGRAGEGAARDAGEEPAARREASPFTQEAQERAERQAADRLQQTRRGITARQLASERRARESDAPFSRAPGLNVYGPSQGIDLDGLPTTFKIEGRGKVEFHGFKPAQDIARRFAARHGATLPTTYATVDEERAKRIAAAYDAMEHAPEDPEVKRAYRAMIDETLAQYRELVNAGLQVEFIEGEDPYAGSPRLAILDVVENNHLWVFPTDQGFGSGEGFAGNPLLEKTNVTFGGKPTVANDVFRAVHDYFGHVANGVGFRADGEENAWREHAAMYSPLARRAMTSETRGQNSWVNYGPHGEANRTAKSEDTVYADQKAGLMPEWTSTEGASDDAPIASRGWHAKPQQKDAIEVDAIHYGTTAGLTELDPKKAGSGGASAERRRFGMGAFGKQGGTAARVNFYVQDGDSLPERERGIPGLGEHPYRVRLTNLYDLDADPRELASRNADEQEENISDAGYDGYVAGAQSGIDSRVAVVFDIGKKKIPVEPVDGPIASRRHITSDEHYAAYREAYEQPEFKRLENEWRDAMNDVSDRHASLIEETFASLADKNPALNSLGFGSDAGYRRSVVFNMAADVFKNDAAYQAALKRAHDAEMDMRDFAPKYVADNYPPVSPFVDEANQERAYFESEPFRRWFRGSKAVDPSGRPLTAFHGSESVFSQFRLVGEDGKNARRKNPEYTGQLGMWFAAPMEGSNYDPGVAESMASSFAGDEGVVYPVHLSIQNPYEFDGWVDLQDMRDNDYGGSVLKMRAGLMRAGHDGVVIRGSDTDEAGYRDDWVAFHPEQVKSAIGNSGEFDPSNPSIIASRAWPQGWTGIFKARANQQAAINSSGVPQGTPSMGPNGRIAPIKDGIDRARELLQDKMLRLLRTQESTGAPVADMLDAYTLENLMHGATHDRLKLADRDFVLKLEHAMRRTGVSVDQLQDYLIARHAPERNAKIATINPAFPDGGSGITTQEARDILAGTAPGPYSGKPLSADIRTKAANLAAIVDAMREETLRVLVASGQITPALARTLRSTYQHYIPLRGDPRTPDWATNPGGTGKGLSMAKPKIKRALGRASLAENILGEMVGDLQRAIVQAEKAKVTQAFLRFAIANPMPSLYTVSPVDLEWKFSEATGDVYLGVKGVQEDGQRSLVLPLNGKPVRIRFEDERLRDAMLNMGTNDMTAFVKIAGAINRWRSAVLTRFNPGFAPVNIVRDAIFGITAVTAEKGAKVAAETVANYPLALWALFADSYRPTGNPNAAQKRMRDWAREYAKAGAKTGMSQAEDVTDLQRKLVVATSGIMELAAKGKLISAAGKPLKAVAGPLLEVIENVNDATENALRLAVYVSMRKSGTSIQQAAEYAKNVTINFNRKGKFGSAINALYLFFNASMQGTHAVLRVLKHPGVQAALAGLAALQFVLAAAMMGDDDDDGVTDWDMIPDYVRRTSFIVPLGPLTGDMKDYYAIPMPYGFNVIPYAGGRLQQWMHTGKRDTDPSLFMDMTKSTFEAFSPMPVTEGYNALFGDTLSFFMQLAANKDDLGRRIADEDPYAPYNTPAALEGRPTTPRIYQSLSQLLAKLGGGDLEQRIAPVGFLDIAPEQLEEVSNFLTGGLGSITNKGMRWWEQMDAGNLDTPMKMVTAAPIASRFVASGHADRAIADRYYGEAGEFARHMDVMKDRIRRGADPETALREAQEQTPALVGVQLDRYKVNLPKRGKKAGDLKMTEGGDPKLKPAADSPFDELKSTTEEVEGLNKAIRQLRSGNAITNDQVADMVANALLLHQGMPEFKAKEIAKIELTFVNGDVDAPNRVRQRAIKMIQDSRTLSQQDFLKALKQARKRE